MAKRKADPAPHPIPDWIETYATELKASIDAAVASTDWDKTPAYERAFVEALKSNIDTVAEKWARDVAHLEAQSRKLFDRLYRKAPAVRPAVAQGERHETD